jgi:hypothetical protein
VLFTWYGHEKRWSGYPVGGVLPALLNALPAEVLADALESGELAETTLEGAARFYARNVRNRGPLNLLSDRIKDLLLEHCISTSDPEKICDARNAFRPPRAITAWALAPSMADALREVGEAGREELLARWVEQGLLPSERVSLANHIGATWASAHEVELVAGLPVYATFVPRCSADSFLGWVERIRWWGAEPSARAAIAASRLVLERRPELITVEGVRKALEAAETWAGCPCAEHDRAAQETRRACRLPEGFRGVKEADTAVVGQYRGDRTADEYLVSAISWSAGAASGRAMAEGRVAVSRAATALAAIEAGSLDDALEFDLHSLEQSGTAPPPVCLEAQALLREAIKQALEPWVIGASDPLQDGVRRSPRSALDPEPPR